MRRTRTMTVKMPGGKTLQATVGPDRDLDTDPIVWRGRTIREKDVPALVEEVRQRIEQRGAGRPSLTGRAAHSPQIAFRLTPEMRRKAEKLAKQRGKTLSALAREAFEEALR